MESVKKYAEVSRFFFRSKSPPVTITHSKHVILRRMVHSRRLVTFTAKIEKKHDFSLESICSSQRAELRIKKRLAIARNNLII
jgi:hypothetical protein